MVEWRARAAELRTVPNLVSLSRLPLVAGIVLLVDSPVRYALFALIVVTDGLDGWLARRLDQTTELGAFLDPALDKLTALLLVAFLFPRLDLALAYLVLFFARDAFVLALGPLVPLYGFDTAKIQARTLGKAVTNLQFLAMVAMLVPAAQATAWILWVLGTVSGLAMVDYAVFVGRELSDTDWVHDRRGVAVAAAGVVVGYGGLVAVVLGGEFLAVFGAIMG